MFPIWKERKICSQSKITPVSHLYVYNTKGSHKFTDGDLDDLLNDAYNLIPSNVCTRKKAIFYKNISFLIIPFLAKGSDFA